MQKDTASEFDISNKKFEYENNLDKKSSLSSKINEKNKEINTNNDEIKKLLKKTAEKELPTKIKNFKDYIEKISKVQETIKQQREKLERDKKSLTDEITNLDTERRTSLTELSRIETLCKGKQQANEKSRCMNDYGYDDIVIRKDEIVNLIKNKKTDVSELTKEIDKLSRN